MHGYRKLHMGVPRTGSSVTSLLAMLEGEDDEQLPLSFIRVDVPCCRQLWLWESSFRLTCQLHVRHAGVERDHRFLPSAARAEHEGTDAVRVYALA